MSGYRTIIRIGGTGGVVLIISAGLLVAAGPPLLAVISPVALPMREYRRRNEDEEPTLFVGAIPAPKSVVIMEFAIRAADARLIKDDRKRDHPFSHFMKNPKGKHRHKRGNR